MNMIASLPVQDYCYTKIFQNYAALSSKYIWMPFRTRVQEIWKRVLILHTYRQTYCMRTHAFDLRFPYPPLQRSQIFLLFECFDFTEIKGPCREQRTDKSYNDVIMGAMASRITGVSIAYLNAYSGAYQRIHQSSASLAFVRGIHRWPVNSRLKWPVTRKMFPFDDGIMKESMQQTWNIFVLYLLIIRYSDVILSTISSQINRVSIVCPNASSGANQRQHQSPASLACVMRIHRWPQMASNTQYVSILWRHHEVYGRICYHGSLKPWRQMVNKCIPVHL